jgi:hypothetical protein
MNSSGDITKCVGAVLALAAPVPALSTCRNSTPLARTDVARDLRPTSLDLPDHYRLDDVTRR